MDAHELKPTDASHFLGGRNITCECGNKFKVPVSETELRERVKLLGGTEVGGKNGRFNQSGRASLLPDDLKETVKGGYCEGMCLDWIRRVMQGGGATFEVSKQLRTQEQITAREASQTYRGATAWVTRYEEPKNQFFQKKESDYKAQLKPVEEASAQARKTYDVLNSAYNRLFDQWNACRYASEQTLLRPEFDEAKRVKDEAFTKLNALIGQSNDLINAHNKEIKKTDLDRFWVSYARLMDDFVAQQRNKEGRKSSKRAFSSLTIAASVPTVEYDSIAQCVDSLLSNPEFKATRAACLGFSPFAEDTGHAVAVHFLNTGAKYHLFDPNLGTFEFGRQGLLQALAVIFGSYYKGYTNVNGKAKSDYSIFSRAGEQCPVTMVKILPPETPKLEVPVVRKIVPTAQDKGLRIAPTGGAGRVSPPVTTLPSSTAAPRNPVSPAIAGLMKNFVK